MYLPGIIIDEAEDLRKEHGIISKSEAFKKLSDYARVGRELERMIKFDFSWKPTPRDIDEGKKKKILGLFDRRPF